MVLPERRPIVSESAPVLPRSVFVLHHTGQANLVLTESVAGARGQSNIVGGAGMRTILFGRQRTADQLHGSGGPIFQRFAGICTRSRLRFQRRYRAEALLGGTK